jgi:hypothetical protein
MSHPHINLGDLSSSRKRVDLEVSASKSFEIKVISQLSIHLVSSRKLPSSRLSLCLVFKGAYSCSPINMSVENAVAAVSSLPAKPEGPFGRPSMFHSSKQFIEAGDLVILHQVSSRNH